MPRDYEIKDACVDAIKRIPAGGVTVTTQDLVRQPERRNFHLSLREANQGIRTHTATFRDESTQEGEAKSYRQFNPNGGI